MHRLEDGEDAGRPEPVAHAERPIGIAEPEFNRGVDVIDAGDALLGDVAADIDDGGNDALGDEAGAVVDHRHRRACGGEERVGAGPKGGIGGRRRHQGAPAIEAEQRIHRHRAPGIEALVERALRRVAAQGGDEAKGVVRRAIGAADLGAGGAKHAGQRLAPVRHRRADPDRALIGFRRWLLIGGDDLAVKVVVEPPPGLAAEKLRDHPLAGDGRWPVARLLIILLIDRFHDRVADIETDEVHELERAHAKTRRIAHDPVDIMVPGDALENDPERLGAETASGMVDDEARRIAANDGMVPHAPRDRGQGIGDPAFGEDAVDDLDDLHQRHRVEEVKAGDAPGQAAFGGNRGDRERRGVGRQHAIVRHDAFQLFEQGALDLEILEHRLDDGMATRQRGLPAADDLDPVLGVPGLARRHAALLGGAVEHLGDEGERIGGGGLVRVDEHHLDAGGGGGLGDAAPHGAGANHTECQIVPHRIESHRRHLPSNSGLRFSMKAFMPSFWSRLANRIWNAFRSSINPVESDASCPAISTSLICMMAKGGSAAI